MGFTLENPYTVEEELTRDQLDIHWQNVVTLKSVRFANPLGGSWQSQITDTVLIEIPGAVYAELDSTELTGMTVEVHCLCKVQTGTGAIRLRNRTLAAYVGGEVSFSSVTPTLVKIPSITLAAGINQYTLYGRGTTAAARPSFWGAKLIVR